MLRSLTGNRDADVRAEARFRLGNLRQNLGDLAGAAQAYRDLLDEKPDATPVRLELARVLSRMGQEDAASSQLRRASSAGLPDDVARIVDQFQSSLRSRRRLGGSIEIGLSPDSNINRANGNDTIDVGSTPFDLSRDAQAQSGLGATIAAQQYWRPAITANTNLLVMMNGSANLYRRSRFNDLGLSLSAGPELLRGSSRFRPAANLGRRWFGGKHYSDSYGVSLNWLRPLNRVSQIQLDLALQQTGFRINPAMTGRATSAVVRYERALSPRLFGRLSSRIDRQAARDPAFATWSAGGELLLSRDVGRQTVYGRGNYTRVRGGAPFSFPPARRNDRLVDVEVGVIVRNLSYWGLAPVVRVRHTDNHSPVFFYDFKRSSVAFGLTREF